MTPVAAGSAILLLDHDFAVPAAAVPVLRAATALHAGPSVPPGVADALGASPAPEDLLAVAAGSPVVLAATDLGDPVAAALHEAGAPVIGAAERPLLAAVAVMDRLRSPGGCPWDAAQTHDSLRRYLVEEAFELVEAIDDGDRDALREELGDVLLQVLFHARVAAEDAEDPFTIDDVAAGLVAKLVGRHPHVFGSGDPAVHDAASQELRWEELKQVEKRRESSVDGVALGQPAVALAAKLVQRVARAGFPVDLLPDGDSAAETLFVVTALAKLAGEEPEGDLRAVGRRFAADVREAEHSARAAGIPPATMTPAHWHHFWPH